MDKITDILNALMNGDTYDDIIKKFHVSSATISRLRDENPLFAGPSFMQRLNTQYHRKNPKIEH